VPGVVVANAVNSITVRACDGVNAAMSLPPPVALPRIVFVPTLNDVGEPVLDCCTSKLCAGV
jgi:hypothetical protein